MAYNKQKGTFGHFRKLSSRISLHRLIRDGISRLRQGLCSPTILKNILGILLQIFLYLEAFEYKGNQKKVALHSKLTIIYAKDPNVLFCVLQVIYIMK